MAYNYFPQNYQTPVYYPTQPNAVSAQSNAQNPLIWVQGEGAAKSFPVAPNQTVPLWDSESQTIYLKSADGSGMPHIRILDYEVREDASQRPEISPKSDFATKDDVAYLKDELGSLKAKFDRIDKMISRAKNKEQSDGK